jgi:rubrerythrin
MTHEELVRALNADLRNERQHLNFYLYHASAVAGLHAHEYREFLLEAAKGEMEHVLAFQDRIFGLHPEHLAGHNSPGLSANAFKSELLTVAPEAILRAALEMENEVVRNYTERLAQLEKSEHPAAAYMKIFYEDQLQDSYEDAERLRRILAGV